jgi:hypothetical protein
VMARPISPTRAWISSAVNRTVARPSIAGL